VAGVEEEVQVSAIASDGFSIVYIHTTASTAAYGFPQLVVVPFVLATT